MEGHPIPNPPRSLRGSCFTSLWPKFLKNLSGQEVTLIRAASDTGQLFGSVSTKDIVNSLAEKNISILKNEIDLNNSVKNLTYEKVTINLHPEVSCEIILNVPRSSEEASTQKQLEKAVTSNSDNEDNNQLDSDVEGDDPQDPDDDDDDY